jgi:hypothetical protein
VPRVADQAFQFGELVYWNGVFLKERARYNDAPTPMRRDQFVDVVVEFALARRDVVIGVHIEIISQFRWFFKSFRRQ